MAGGLKDHRARGRARENDGEAMTPAYRFLVGRVLVPLVRSVFSSGRRLGQESPSIASHSGVWFHAASAGELETLIPIIEEILDQKISIVLSVFSPSAVSPLNIWLTGLSAERRKLILHTGLSPWEGEWKAALETCRPQIFVTSKYEAWPELWDALAEMQIPLAIVGAQWRSSMRTALRMLAFWARKPPELILLPFSEGSANGLKRALNARPGQREFSFQITIQSDPRWDRIQSRKNASLKNLAAQKIISEVLTMSRPHPWLFIGSAWVADLKFAAPILSQWSGTVFVVPHRVDAKSQKEWTEFLSGHPALQARTVVIAQMGVLLELYSLADGVWVGGGFSRGLHSTMEPAVYGVPIFAGPKNADRFDEIGQLQATGRLLVSNEPSEFAKWLQRLKPLAPGQVSPAVPTGGAKSIAAVIVARIKSPAWNPKP